MKNTISLIIAVFVVIFLIQSCEKENNNNQSVSGKIIANSECKSLKSTSIVPDTSDSVSCVEYSLDTLNDKLSIKHINAGFNCCPEKLYCNVTLSEDTIIIEEFEKSALCDCNCLYDLDILITGVETKIYQVKFIEPYCVDEEKIIFEMDLANNVEGSYCVLRDRYPWGIH